ncbi:MAG: amidohydrolase family protein [Candidatus Aminicenantes bacterium]|nr:amidohydrolase family protein [Candidatus Aminicenantes bacterium]
MTCKNFSGFLISFFCLFIIFQPFSLYGGETYVIKADKIYTATAGVIPNGMILVKDGKIARVGKDFSVPKGTKFIKADVVLPGLIDIHCHLGVYSIPFVQENSDGNEMTNPITPQVRALDSFNFDDPAIKAGLAGGVTTVVSRPGSGNIIGGTSVAVKLKDASPSEMVLKEDCDLKMAIEGNPVGVYGSRKQMPSTLMAVYFMAEKAFLDAQDYMKSWEKYEKEKKDNKDAVPPNRDLGKENLVKALKREIPVHIHCATASEIASCIRLADAFNLKLSLGHCYYAHLIIDDIADRKDVYFNTGPPMFFTYYDDILHFKHNPAILADAGLKVSLQTDAIGGGQQNLLHLAALCYRYGMKEEDAVKAITIHEAEAIDLQDRIGSIEEGKDADFVLLDGDPFEMTTSVRKVIIDGNVEYENEMEELQNASSPEPSAASGELSLPKDFANAKKFALRGGTVFTMAGAPVRNGVILVENGKIKQVGADVSVPDGYPLIDAGEFVVMPGLISARSYVGISSNWRNQSSIDEISKPVVPEMEVKHAIEPQAPHFAFCRELGITTVMVTPGNRNVLGGQGVVVKTEGAVVDKMIAKDKAVMVMGLGASAKRENQMPSTRMGVAALLRETLTQAKDYREKTEKYAKDKQGTEPQKDSAMEALLPVLKGDTPMLVHCERRDDILTALRIADEFGLKVIFDGVTDAYKVVEEIRKRNIPVILEDLYRGAGSIEDKGFNPENPAILSNAGVKIAFRSNEGAWYSPGVAWSGGDLLEIAAMAVKYGMSEEAALKAVTIDAAEIIGVDDRIGSLEPGKDADILILRGHPLRIRSVPETVFIDGKLVYKRRAGERMN